MHLKSTLSAYFQYSVQNYKLQLSCLSYRTSGLTNIPRFCLFIPELLQSQLLITPFCSLYLWVVFFLKVSHTNEIIFLYLANFTWQNVLYVHPYCCNWQDFLISQGWIICSSTLSSSFICRRTQVISVSLHFGYCEQCGSWTWEYRYCFKVTNFMIVEEFI